MRKVWYIQIWIQTYLGFIVLILMQYSSRILKNGEIQILLVIAEVGRDRIFNDAEWRVKYFVQLRYIFIRDHLE